MGQFWFNITDTFSERGRDTKIWGPWKHSEKAASSASSGTNPASFWQRTPCAQVCATLLWQPQQAKEQHSWSLVDCASDLIPRPHCFSPTQRSPAFYSAAGSGFAALHRFILWHLRVHVCRRSCLAQGVLFVFQANMELSQLCLLKRQAVLLHVILHTIWSFVLWWPLLVSHSLALIPLAFSEFFMLSILLFMSIFKSAFLIHCFSFLMGRIFNLINLARAVFHRLSSSPWIIPQAATCLGFPWALIGVLQLIPQAAICLGLPWALISVLQHQQSDATLFHFRF